MTVTQQTLLDFKATLKTFAGAFYNVDVIKVEAPADPPITVKGYIGIRSSSSPLRNSINSDLTGAADQDTYTCLFLAEDWDAVSPGRPPRKGDVVLGNGMRYAIDRTILAQPGGIPMVYKSQVKG